MRCMARLASALLLLLVTLVAQTESRKSREVSEQCNGGKCEEEANKSTQAFDHEAIRQAFELRFPQKNVHLQWSPQYGGWSVHATRRLKAGSIVIMDNLSTSALTVDKARALHKVVRGYKLRQLVCPLGRTCTLEVLQDFLLTLLVLVERARGSKSKFAEYFALFEPQVYVNSSLHMSEEDIECLPTQDAAYKRTFMQLSEAGWAGITYVAQQTDLFPSGAPSKQEFEWAEMFTHARQVGAEAPMEKAIIPWAHLVNHNPRRGLGQSSNEGYQVILAAEDLAPGDEVYDSYGELSIQNLLRNYGFVDHRTPQLGRLDLDVLHKNDRCYSADPETTVMMCGADSAVNVPFEHQPDFIIRGLQCKAGKPHSSLEQRLKNCAKSSIRAKLSEIVDANIQAYQARMQLKQCQVTPTTKTGNLPLIRQMHAAVIEQLQKFQSV